MSSLIASHPNLLSTPSLGITGRLQREWKHPARELSTPSLGITLRGRRIGTPIDATFNSLSRDHGLDPTERIQINRITFNSLSRDH